MTAHSPSSTPAAKFEPSLQQHEREDQQQQHEMGGVAFAQAVDQRAIDEKEQHQRRCVRARPGHALQQQAGERRRRHADREEHPPRHLLAQRHERHEQPSQHWDVDEAAGTGLGERKTGGEPVLP